MGYSNSYPILCMCRCFKRLWVCPRKLDIKIGIRKFVEKNQNVVFVAKIVQKIWKKSQKAANKSNITTNNIMVLYYEQIFKIYFHFLKMNHILKNELELTKLMVPGPLVSNGKQSSRGSKTEKSLEKNKIQHSSYFIFWYISAILKVLTYI